MRYLALLLIIFLAACGTSPKPAGELDLSTQAFYWGETFNSGSFSGITHPCGAPGGKLGPAYIDSTLKYEGAYSMNVYDPTWNNYGGIRRGTCEGQKNENRTLTYSGRFYVPNDAPAGHWKIMEFNSQIGSVFERISVELARRTDGTLYLRLWNSQTYPSGDDEIGLLDTWGGTVGERRWNLLRVRYKTDTTTDVSAENGFVEVYLNGTLVLSKYNINTGVSYMDTWSWFVGSAPFNVPGTSTSSYEVNWDDLQIID